jgi:hypothetical protein
MKYITTLALLIGMASHAHAQNDVDSAMRRQTETMSKTLPRQVDPVTRLNSVEYQTNPRASVYKYTTAYSRADLMARETEIIHANVPSLCAKIPVRNVLRAGVIHVSHYHDRNGTFGFVVVVDNKLCAQITGIQ